MTRDGDFKKRVRAYAAEHGMKYTEALRALRGDDKGGSEPFSAAELLANYPTPTALAFEHAVGLLDPLAGDMLTDHGLALPERLGFVEHAFAQDVTVNRDACTADITEDLDTDRYYVMVTAQGELTVVGETSMADALELERTGQGRRWFPDDPDTGEPVTVILTDRFGVAAQATVHVDGEDAEVVMSDGFWWTSDNTHETQDDW